jgi:3-deoxy-D-manno-octulosonate 8-phosphate phosphatase (KDO 8-P phosphatase)
MTEVDSATHAMSRIRAIALDVDGVLTDGGVWWGPNGEEWKRFSFVDIMGVSLALRAGLNFALISGEDSPLVDRYARKLRITHVAKGCRDKAHALREYAASAGIDLTEICYMGDDVNDLPAMRIAGFSAAPSNAAREVISSVNFVAKASGGSGAVRELVEELLTARGLRCSEIFAKSLSQ